MATILDVIDGLYDAAEINNWQNAAENISSIIDAYAVHLFISNHGPGGVFNVQSIATTRVDPTEYERYISHYHAIDPRIKILRNNTDKIIYCTEHFSDDFVKKDPFFQEFYIPISIRYSAGITSESGGLFTNLGVNLRVEAEPFSSEQRQLLAELAPHWRRAARLGQVWRKCERLQGALDTLDLAIFVVSGVGRVLVMNDRAEQLVRTGEGLSLRFGILTTSHPGEAARFSHALRRASGAKPRAGSAMLLFTATQGALAVTIGPVGGDNAALGGGANSGAMVMVRPLARPPTTTSAALMALFRLTPAEAAITLDLVAGLRVQDIAEQRQTSLNTLRGHVRAILAKMGVDRQSDVVRLVAGLPPLPGG